MCSLMETPEISRTRLLLNNCGLLSELSSINKKF